MPLTCGYKKSTIIMTVLLVLCGSASIGSSKLIPYPTLNSSALLCFKIPAILLHRTKRLSTQKDRFRKINGSNSFANMKLGDDNLTCYPQHFNIHSFPEFAGCTDTNVLPAYPDYTSLFYAFRHCPVKIKNGYNKTWCKKGRTCARPSLATIR